MKLADWMHMHGITPQQLRRMLGLKSRTTILRYISGEHRPSPETMAKIEGLSDGLVTELDFADPSPPLCARVVTDCHGQRKVLYPWTRYEEGPDTAPVKRLKSAHERRWRGVEPPPKRIRVESGEPVDVWPSPPIRRAMEVLGPRVRLTRRGGVLLDGRISDFRRMMQAANDELRRRGSPPIPYPGVEPLL